MDTIFYNGKIYTEDRAYPICSAVAVKNGVIVALGEDEEILMMADADTEKIDLAGRLMLPGFVDTHLHMLFYAQEASLIDLTDCKSYDDVKRLCAERVDWAQANDKWVQGTGFNQDDWDEKIIPTRKDLDQITEEVPLTIRRTCHHVTVCNTKAMETMGLMGEKEDVTQINMGFFEDGSPNGILKEDSQNAVTDALPLPNKEEIKKLILFGCNRAAAQGITELHSDDFMLIPGEAGEKVMEAYRELSEAGELPIRIYQQCMLWGKDLLQQFIDKGHRTGESYGFYRVGPLKIVTDGSLGAHTAYMRKPYANDPQTKGKANYTDEQLYEMCKLAHDHGMQIATHCIGDGSLQQILDAYEKVQMENPRTDCRHGVVHCQIMDEEQQDQFRKQNLLAYVQPVFVRYDMNIVDDCVGSDLAKTSYNWRRFEDLGVHQSGGSDCPVEKFDILPNIEYAVTRTNRELQKSWYPENAVTLEEAVKLFTYEGAYASFAENVRGSITVGKYADLVVVDKDIFEIPVEEIHTATVVMTMVNGRVAYKRQ